MVMIPVRSYEADRIFSSLREEHGIDMTQQLSSQMLQQTLDTVWRSDNRLKNLGEEGKRLVYEEAFKEWQGIPREVHNEQAMVLRERGLITADEYYLLSQSQGLSHEEAESNYRKFSGSMDAIFWMKERRLLRFGEASKLYKAKGMSYSTAWRKWRIWEDEKGIRTLPKYMRRNLPPKDRQP
jgi:hypothetical protein